MRKHILVGQVTVVCFPYVGLIVSRLNLGAGTIWD